MPNLFCPSCHEKLMASLRREIGADKRFVVNEGECVYACKIPIYELNERGAPVVKIWDCVNNRTLFYSQQEWERKQRDGEV